MFDKKVDETLRRIETIAGLGINVDLKTLDRFECPCGNKVFTKAYEAYMLPAPLSPSGKKGVIIKEVIRCTSCGKLFHPETLTA